MATSKILKLLGATFIFLSIVSSLLSNRYNSIVMGEAALGAAVYGYPKGTPEWDQKVEIRNLADVWFSAGLVFAFLGLLLEVAGVFIANSGTSKGRNSVFGDFDEDHWNSTR